MGRHPEEGDEKHDREKVHPAPKEQAKAVYPPQEGTEEGKEVISVITVK